MFRSSPVLGLLVVGAFLGTPVPTSAKILITHGDHIEPLGTIRMQAGMGAANPGLKVGFKYSHFGVFWMNIWTWGGEYCTYQGDKYNPISRALAAELMGVDENTIGPPFSYSWPPGLLILGGLILIGIVGTYLEKSRQTPAQKLLRDPRYQQALALYREHAGESAIASGHEYPEGEARRKVAYEKAVQSLLDYGVMRTDAEEQLALLGVAKPK